MAINKDQKTFEYFKNEGFVLYGKFARYVDAMWTQNRISENSRFARLLDLYAIAAVTGLRLGKRLPNDKDTSDKRSIPLEFWYQLIKGEKVW